MTKITIDVSKEETGNRVRVAIGDIVIVDDVVANGYSPMARRIGMVILDMLQRTKVVPASLIGVSDGARGGGGGG